MAARGLTNNNPGNIRHSAQTWQGQAKEQPDLAFVTFTSAQFGIRALARTLLTYQNAHGCNTIRKIIGRWAPPNENDTDAYVNHVADCVGVKPDDVIDADQVGIMLPLAKAIILHENGQQPYSDAVLLEGLRMAGVSDAKPKPLFSTNQAKAALGVIGTSGTTAAIGLQGFAGQATQAIQPYAQGNIHLLKIVSLLGMIAAACGVAALVFQLLHKKAIGA